MFNVNLRTIPINDMRYNSVLNYWTEGGVIQIRIASMGNANYEFLASMQAMIEKMYARNEGITEQAIDAWNLMHEGTREPSEAEGCPYRDAARLAEGVTRVLAIKMDIDWAKYQKARARVMMKEFPDAD